MFKIIITIILAFAIAFPQSNIKAQSCTSAAKVTADIWDVVGPYATTVGCASGDPTLCTAAQLAEFTAKCITFWNNQVNNSWATIGPRDMEFGKTYTGTLVGTSGRLFISPYPSTSDEVTVTIDETDGKAKTAVVVCKVNKNNEATQVAEKWFNDTDERQDKKDEHREIVVKGAKNHIIVVHFDAKSALNSFSYKLRAK
jgi:hypothetical protein